MAKVPNPKKELQTSHREFATVAAIIWFGLFVLTFLSLVSFNPDDVGWLKNYQNETPTNVIGWLGATWSGILFFGIGLAAYLVPALFLAASVGLFMHHIWHWGWKSLWSVVLLLSAACLLHLQPFIGKQWATDMGNVGPGGFVGKMVGEDLLARMILGKGGSAIVLTMFYICSLLMLFNLNLKQVAITAWEMYLEYRKRKEEALAESSPFEKLSAQERAIEKRRQELQKQLLRDEGNRPKPMIEPRINDTTSTTPLSAKEKRELARKSKPEPEPKSEPAPKPEPQPEPIPTPEPVLAAAATTPGDDEKEKKEKALPAIHDNTRRSRSKEKLPAAEKKNDFSTYQLPTMELLQANSPDKRPVTNYDELRANSQLLVSTLAEFGIEVEPGEITKGATITRYEVKPADGVRVDKISSLQRDIARVMKAERVNILAPIPGKDTVGIEVANSKKAPIVLRDLFETTEWGRAGAKIPIAIGKDVYGQTLVTDLAEMPHLLIAGTTGSGKSVSINCILMSFLFKFKPDELRLILVDPKQVELQVYNTIPHLVVPVVTDPKKVLLALKWIIKEMEDRYKILAKCGVRNIHSFNNRPRGKTPEQGQLDLGAAVAPAAKTEDSVEVGDNPEEKLQVKVPRDDEIHIPDRLPYIVLVIDELADLMQTAPADVESAIARLTAKARAAGIHLILATQTPRREVITGVIKTNVPSRIAFQVPSALDSRVILDENGAENLLGKGDLLYLPPGSSKLTRGQGAFVSDDEVKKVVDFCAAQGEPQFHPEIHNRLSRETEEGEEVSADDYELLIKSLEVLRQEKRASTSLLQRRLRLGYNRAAWVMDHFEGLGIVGPENGAKPRELLVDLDTYELPQQ